MLSSHKTGMPRGLRGSPAKGVPLTSTAATTLYSRFSPTTSYLLGKRNFSWGPKHKSGSKNAGKVWKGFSTYDHTRSRKQLYRGTYWNHHYVPHLRPYLPFQEWRLSSSWGKPGTAHSEADKAPTSSTKSNGKMEEDWYCNYQQQKRKKYDEFIKRMEEDPIGMLFGRGWASWIDGAESKLANASAPSPQRDDVSGKSKTPSRDGGNGRTTISVKVAGEQNTAEQPHPRTVSDQSHEQDYEIDPITNRKVPKPHVKSKTPHTMKVAPKLNTPVMPDTSPKSTSSMMTLALGTKESFEIPVRRFVPPTDSSSANLRTQRQPTSTENELERRKIPCPQRPGSWLAQEGFGLKQVVKPDAQSTHDLGDGKPKASNSRIESALDRHVQPNNLVKSEVSRSALQYDPAENTAEDIDLLRASDVRASAGLRGKAPKESDVEKRARHLKLEEEYESRGMHREIQLAQEVAAKKQQQTLESMTETAPKEAPSESMLKLRALDKRYNEHTATNTERFSELSDAEANPAPKLMELVKQTAEATITEKANKIKAQIVPLKARLDAVKADYDALRQRWLDEKRRKEEKAAKRARDMHEEEVNAQKVAMNAMEMRGVESTSKRNTAVADEIGSRELAHKPVRRQLQSMLPGEGDMASNVHEFGSRDRWYKKKAPHASDELDVKHQRLAKDKALIQEVRGIYEDTYGTIDTNHRQPPQSEEVLEPLSTPKTQASTSTFLPHSDTASSSASTNPHRPSSAEVLQPWQAFHASLLGSNPSFDPLAIIQKLFDELRQGQAFVQDRHTSLQHPEVSATIQKLFSELRQIQAIIKNCRTNVKRISSPEDFATMLQTVRRACNQSKGITSKWAGEVATFGPDASGVNHTPKINVDHSVESKSFRPLTIYRILAFDSTKQEIVSSKATSLAPFQPLLPVESLKLLNNPGRFLPEVMSLHNKGFTLVAGTSNTLVFQKPANTQEFEDSGREQVMKGIDYVDLMGVSNRIAGGCGPDMTRKDSSVMQNQQHEDSPVSITPPSAPSTPPISASHTSATADNRTTVSATSKTAESKPVAPSTASSSPSSGRVRRQEAVFSGRSRGNWQETERRRTSKKHKRAEKQYKRSKFKNVLVTGTVTAAFCYAVGVVSQMMQH